MTGGAQDDERDALQDALAILQQILANGPVPATDVKRQANRAPKNHAFFCVILDSLRVRLAFLDQFQPKITVILSAGEGSGFGRRMY